MSRGWHSVPFWSLYDRIKRVGFPNEELLSVYRDYGVIRKSDRDDNLNRPGQDLSVYQLVEPNDLVLNKMKTWQGSLGVSGYRGIVSPAYFVYRPLTQNDSRFLHYALRSDDYVQEYAKNSKGVRPDQWDLQPELLNQMHVCIPDLRTQRRIADYLDRETGEIDAILAKLDEMAEVLEQRKLTVIRRETQQDHEGHSWQMAPIGALFDSIGSGTTPNGSEFYTDDPEAGVPWLTTSELRENVICQTQRFVTPRAVASHSALKVHPSGSVAIAMYGATIGRLGVLGRDATTNQACCVFSSPRGLDMRFFYLTLIGQKEAIMREAVGGGQPNISQGTLRGWRVPLPPVPEQRRIADHLDEVTGRIDAMLGKVAKLKELLTERRAALITEVVTGRKEV